MKNVLRLAQVFWAYKAGRSSLTYNPLRLWVEPTNHCNLRCKMCPQGQDEPVYEKGFMELALFEKIIGEAVAFHSDVNLFLGGESLLHPNITEMIAICKEQGVPSRLYTNATLLNEKKSTELIRAGLKHITFSFDGTDKSRYEEYRRGAQYNKTLEKIREFLALKNSLGTREPYVVIQCIDFKGSSNSMITPKSFKRLFHQRMVNKFTFIEPHSFAGAYGGSAGNKNQKSYSPCTFLWYSMSVLWDGTVVPCCIDVFKKHPLGNVQDSSLNELWNSRALVELRRQLYQGEYSEVPLCSQCDVLWKRKLFGIPTKSFYNFTDMISHIWK